MKMNMKMQMIVLNFHHSPFATRWWKYNAFSFLGHLRVDLVGDVMEMPALLVDARADRFFAALL